MANQGLGTLVTYNPSSISLGVSLEEVAQRLLQSSFHHWPVVDEQRRVVGMISDDNVVRALAEIGAAMAAAVPVATKATVEQIMSTRVLTIDRAATAKYALTMLLDHDINSLPVVEDDRLVGILTTTDVLREISYGETELPKVPVSRQMLKTDEAVEADATLDEAREAMMVAGLKYLPVIKGECPLGIISQPALRKAKCAELYQATIVGTDQLESPTVADLVKSAPTIKPGAKLSQAAALMVDHNVRAVAVVNQTSRLLGLISEDAILATAASALD